eukprot:CAMPEP_0174903438 /NCGR_PEP_ID=MMETSP0167-20121228/43795_1 /TAXON_ID=38298 /ORGANISM="Rhodella maculata, Strain CCMP736" /LENGTH=39 /DNA_ID= /DNA_START= /DNA_END= /DNA_ORIENTATION=
MTAHKTPPPCERCSARVKREIASVLLHKMPERVNRMISD